MTESYQFSRLTFNASGCNLKQDKMMRKTGLICSIAAFFFLALIAGVSAVQFYQPNRSARLVVTLKAKERYRSKPVVVTVMLTNQALDPLLINSRMLFNKYPLPGEISFQIHGPDNKEYPLVKAIAPFDLRDTDLTVLPPGQTMEQIADLTDLYGVRKRGKYRIQAIYYNSIDLEK